MPTHLLLLPWHRYNNPAPLYSLLLFASSLDASQAVKDWEEQEARGAQRLQQLITVQHRYERLAARLVSTTVACSMRACLAHMHRHERLAARCSRAGSVYRAHYGMIKSLLSRLDSVV